MGLEGSETMRFNLKLCRCKALPYCTWREPDISKYVPLEPQVKGYICMNDLPCPNDCGNCAYRLECKAVKPTIEL